MQWGKERSYAVADRIDHPVLAHTPPDGCNHLSIASPRGIRKHAGVTHLAIVVLYPSDRSRLWLHYSMPISQSKTCGWRAEEQQPWSPATVSTVVRRAEFSGHGTQDIPG